MGLFDKKKKGHDDFDSPVEQIDLSAADPTGLAASAADHDDDSGGDQATSAAAGADSSPSRTAASSGSSGRARAGRSRKSAGGGNSAYGIDDAIALMRTLPSENVELVVQVVKHTLESASIDIRVIIDDASDKQERLESRVAVLRDAISDLEREIAVRRKEIEELEADHKETTRVKERLMLAEKLTRAGKGGDASKGDATKEPAPAAAATAVPAPARQRRPTSEHVTARSKPPTSPPLPGIPASPASSAGSGPAQGTFPGGAGSPMGGKTTHTIVPKK